MAAATYRIETVLSEMFGQNAYLLYRDGSPGALVVDPGLDSAAMLQAIEHAGVRPVAILNTHGHYDHIAGNAAMKRAFPDIPLIIGRNERHLLTDPMANLSGQYGLPLTSPAADRLLDDGETLELGGFSFHVREIPGHSPGSVVFVAEGESPPFVLGGDVLFAGSVGRTDFPGGSQSQLFAGIRAKLFPLPDEVVVYSGHGPTTTIGTERRTNPFVGETS